MPPNPRLSQALDDYDGATVVDKGAGIDVDCLEEHPPAQRGQQQAAMLAALFHTQAENLDWPCQHLTPLSTSSIWSNPHQVHSGAFDPTSPNVKRLKIQADPAITPAVRVSLVDFLTAAAAGPLQLSSSCLHRAVSYLDLVLSRTSIKLPLLQPLGMTCLWLAAKYELGVCAPPADRFAALLLRPDGRALSAVATGKKLLVLLERMALAALEYKLAGVVTAADFLHCFSVQLSEHEAAGYGTSSSSFLSTTPDSASCDGCLSPQTATLPSLDGPALQPDKHQVLYLVAYLLDISLLEYSLLPWQPSQIAAAALGCAHALLGLPVDVAMFRKITGHDVTALTRVMQMLLSLFDTMKASINLGCPYSVSIIYCRLPLQHPQLQLQSCSRAAPAKLGKAAEAIAEQLIRACEQLLPCDD
eukprot:gene8437-8621_t